MCVYASSRNIHVQQRRELKQITWCCGIKVIQEGGMELLGCAQAVSRFVMTGKHS